MLTNSLTKKTTLIFALYVPQIIGAFAFANTNSDACLAEPSPAIIEGHVINKKPRAGVTVTVKDCHGILVGSSVTDQQGHYSMAGTGTPPYFAQAMLRQGNHIHGYSHNGTINLDPVIDAIMTLWYRKQDYEADRVFEQLDQQPILPDPYEIEALYYTLFAQTDKKSTNNTIGKLNEPLTHQVKKTFRTVTITQHKTRIKVKYQNTQQTTQLSDEGDHDHFIEFSGKIRSYNSQKKIVKSTDYEILNTVSYNSDNGSNHAWMAELQPDIGTRLLSQIALPGTHDSGMYDCSGKSCSETAVTQQDRTITDQLNDGIRYFDFRIAEVAHRDCADPTVFRIVHGGYWGPDKRFNNILADIGTYLRDSRHSKEIIILDLQSISLKYDDNRALLVLLATIQKELGDWIRPIDDIRTTKISDFADTRRVFVLMQPDTLLQLDAAVSLFWYKPDEIQNDCDIDIKTLGERGGFIESIGDRFMMLNSYYRGREKPDDLRGDINNQISTSQSTYNLLFDRYRIYQSHGLLNVLQIVFRPSNGWYVCAFLGGCAQIDELLVGRPHTLMEYARMYNGYFSVVPEKNCYGGWLGKRVWMAINASGGQTLYWNKPNIFIIDNYYKATGGDWVNAYWKDNKWYKETPHGYVDFIKSINKNSYAQKMNYTPPTTFSDECLP